MAIDIYASSTLDGLEPEEQKLADLINNYRSQNGLPPIPLSRALTIVANRHVLDLAENFVTPPSNMHSWSWGTFDLNNQATYPNMWEAPQRLGTGYPGYGYENAHGGSSGYVATADSAFNGWRNSAPHNAVILNQGQWQPLTWDAMGIGIYRGYAVAWFGDEPDPTGTPNSSSSPPPTIGGTPPGNTDDSILIGTSGGDQIQGGSRPNFIAGLGGNDVLSGGAGNDTIRGGKGADVIDGEDGDDTCYGDRDDDIVTGGKGNDAISGGKGNDQLFGGEGEDTLLGGIGIDVLEGGPGTDVLILWAAEANADPNQVDRLFYNDLEDYIGLTDGLSFDSLTFELVDAGAGSAPDTLIRIAGGLALGIVLDTMPTDLNPVDFVAV